MEGRGEKAGWASGDEGLLRDAARRPGASRAARNSVTALADAAVACVAGCDGEKAVRRERARAARAAMTSDERAAQSARMCVGLLALPQVRAAKTLACYLAFGDELDLGEFMQASLARGQRVCLPVTLSGRRLAFVDVQACDLADRARLPRCLREPQRPLPTVSEELAERVVSPSEIDVAVLPGLAFDRKGTRLGYGGGYYDAWLEKAFGSGGRPLLIGTCFDCQLLPPGEALPREPHDMAMDLVATSATLWGELEISPDAQQS